MSYRKMTSDEYVIVIAGVVVAIVAWVAIIQPWLQG